MKEGKEGRVEIHDFNKDTVDVMLKWIYFGVVELEGEDLDEIMELYKVSHKYCLEPLLNYLTLIIVEHHTQPEKAVEIFEFGHLYESNAMIEMAKEVIKK